VRRLLAVDATASRTTDFGLLVLRLFTGLALAFGHGINKLPPSERFLAGVVEMGFPAPLFFAWASGLAEFGGGLLLALGLLTRPAALLVAINMFVAAFIRQAGDPFKEVELAYLFLAVAVLYAVAGPGRLSLDAWLGGRTSSAGQR
jgi:putative oxidoreductase